MVCQLNAGQYFGEYTCFFGEPRVATVVSITFCELYSLSSHDVEQVQEDWPDLEADLSLLREFKPLPLPLLAQAPCLARCMMLIALRAWQ